MMFYGKTKSIKMSDSRTKNVSRNIFIGIILKIVTLLLPFITRTLLIYLLGTDSVGVSTLFTSILSFLSLAELGFGSAVVYSMYKPIADEDYTTINSLLNYYKKLYRIIGFLILIIGIILIPFLPFLIKDEVPSEININSLYLLFLVNTVISYFFAGYRQSILIAYQRTDIRDKIAILVLVFVRIGEVLAIYFTKSLYVYEIVAIIGTVITNVLTAIVTRRMFPNIKCEGTIELKVKKDISKRLGGLFGTKLNSIVVNQADSIVISSFLGLKLLTQYGNYYYILNAVSGVIMILFTSMTASIGNKIASDSSETVFVVFKRINFLNNWVVGWCTICLACLYHPFMIIWVKDSLSLPIAMSFLMALYFYVSQVQRALLTFKDAAGLWYEDRLRPFISMIINLVSNLILVNLIGIYGIVLSTIISFLISIPWCNYIVFKYLFKLSPLKNIKQMLLNFLITLGVGSLTFFVCSFFDYSIIGLIYKIIVCLFIPNLFYLILFMKTDECMYYKDICLRFLRREK